VFLYLNNVWYIFRNVCKLCINFLVYYWFIIFLLILDTFLYLSSFSVRLVVFSVRFIVFSVRFVVFSIRFIVFYFICLFFLLYIKFAIRVITKLPNSIFLLFRIFYLSTRTTHLIIISLCVFIHYINTISTIICCIKRISCWFYILFIIVI
jgi:hypothetical protein